MKTTLPVDDLIDALADGDRNLRLNALTLLSEQGGVDVAERLKVLEGTAAPELRYLLRRAIDQITQRELARRGAFLADEEIRSALARLASSNPQERMSAVAELANQREHPEVLRALVDALEKEPEGGVVEALLDLVAQPDLPGAREAISVRVYESDGRISASALDALARISPARTLPLALAQLDAPNPRLRASAIRLVGRLQPVQAAAALERMVRDGDLTHRAAAATLLADPELEIENRLPLLVQLAEGRDAGVRAAARAVLIREGLLPDDPTRAAGRRSTNAGRRPPRRAKDDTQAVLKAALSTLARIADRPPPSIPAPTVIVQPAEPPAPEMTRMSVPRGEPYTSDLRGLLSEALAAGASDLHLGTGYPPLLRVHGEMLPIQGRPVLKAGHIHHLLAPVAPREALERFVEDGDLDISVEMPGVCRFRLNALRDIHGPGVVIRLISSKIRSLTELESPTILTRLLREARGLVLVTGPTGSGKSTTCAAMIDHLNENQHAHIITIEDPVEFVHAPKKSRITQREVGPSTRSFARALRAALRQDPDVVLVGEMRDLETIELALTAAETGHLVLATLHTSSAPKTVDRIVNVFPADRQEQVRVTLSEALLGVISQTLIRRSDRPGRVAAYEIMFRVPAVSNMIREGKTHQLPNVIQSNAKQGMRLLDHELTRLVDDRVIAFEEALAYANDKEAFRESSARSAGAPRRP